MCALEKMPNHVSSSSHENKLTITHYHSYALKHTTRQKQKYKAPTNSISHARAHNQLRLTSPLHTGALLESDSPLSASLKFHTYDDTSCSWRYVSFF